MKLVLQICAVLCICIFSANVAFANDDCPTGSTARLTELGSFPVARANECQISERDESSGIGQLSKDTYKVARFSVQERVVYRVECEGPRNFTVKMPFRYLVGENVRVVSQFAGQSQRITISQLWYKATKQALNQCRAEMKAFDEQLLNSTPEAEVSRILREYSQTLRMKARANFVASEKNQAEAERLQSLNEKQRVEAEEYIHMSEEVEEAAAALAPFAHTLP